MKISHRANCIKRMFNQIVSILFDFFIFCFNNMNLTKTKKDELNQQFPWPGPVYLERLAVYFSHLD